MMLDFSGKQLTLNLAKSTLFATCINVFSLGDLITLLSLIQWPNFGFFLILKTKFDQFYMVCKYFQFLFHKV